MYKNSQVVPIEYALAESYRLLHKIKQEIDVILIAKGGCKLLSNLHNKVIDAINEIGNNAENNIYSEETLDSSTKLIVYARNNLNYIHNNHLIVSMPELVTNNGFNCLFYFIGGVSSLVSNFVRVIVPKSKITPQNDISFEITKRTMISDEEDFSIGIFDGDSVLSDQAISYEGHPNSVMETINSNSLEALLGDNSMDSSYSYYTSNPKYVS